MPNGVIIEGISSDGKRGEDIDFMVNRLDTFISSGEDIRPVKVIYHKDEGIGKIREDMREGFSLTFFGVISVIEEEVNIIWEG